MSSSSRPESDGSNQTPGIEQARTPAVTGDAAPTSASVPGEPAPSPSAAESERRPSPAAGTAGSGMRTVIRSLLPQRSLSPSAGQPLDPGSPAIWEHDSLGPPAPATQADRAAEAPRADVATRATGTDVATGTDERPQAPGRPTRTVVLAVVCGAALLSVPFLVIGTGGHGGKKHSTSQVTLDVADKPNSGLPLSAAPTGSPSKSGKPRTTTHPHHSSAALPPAKPHSGRASSAATSAAPQPHKTTAKPQGPGIAQTFGGASHVLLRDLGTNLCADLPDYGAGKSGLKVEQFTCLPGSGDNQMWTLKVSGSAKGPGGARVFTVSNDKDGLCMDIPNYAGEPAGTAVSEYRCDSTTSDNQLWYLAPVDAHHYRLRNLASAGQCLTVSGGASAGLDARLVIEPCQSSADGWAMTTS